jgi:serine protease AprX
VLRKHNSFFIAIFGEYSYDKVWKNSGGKMEQVRKRVHAQEVYRQGYTGRNIRIAVLDTGIFLHRDVRANLTGFLDFVNGRSACYDDNGHGTHVAGIICGNGGVYGIAPEANIIALKVLDRQGGGETKHVLEALEWVLAKHRTYRIRIINFSVGFLPGAGDKEQEQIVGMLEQLWDEGVVVVTAAGNNGPREGSVTVPGISRKVITVGSSDDENPGHFLPRYYSGRGPTGCCIIKPEILAPGTNIISLDHRGHHYVRKSGTSMATPVVTGALALALQKNPSLRPEELKLKLYQSAVAVEENPYTWGILHVDNLMDLI